MTQWEAREKTLSAKLYTDRTPPYTTAQQHTGEAGSF